MHTNTSNKWSGDNKSKVNVLKPNSEFFTQTRTYKVKSDRTDSLANIK